MTNYAWTIRSIIGYSCEVSEPAKPPITAHILDRWMQPRLDALVKLIQDAVAEHQQRADHFEHCFKQVSCGNCPFSGLALRECKSTICDCFEFPWIEPLRAEGGRHASAALLDELDVPEMDLPGMWSYSDFAGEFRGGVDHQ